MTDRSEPPRPVPRWVHAWAYLTLAGTVVLLVLGQLVTTFRAGMADPVWPTEPWYIFATADAKDRERYKIDFGYFVEHTHRMAGFTVGTLAAVLTLGIWWTEPRRAARWAGIAGLVVLLAAYGQFHTAVAAEQKKLEALAAEDRPAGTVGRWVPTNFRPEHVAQVRLPGAPTAIMAVALVGVVAVGATGSGRAAGLRVLAVVTLAALMVQGLLGGGRVLFNALVGPELAIIHGVFAQVVFSLLVAVTVLTARPPAAEWLGATRRTVARLSLLLVGLLLVQLVWGAMVRHNYNPLNQRLHFLTAFLVVAAVVVLVRAGLADRAAPRGVTVACWALAALVVLQVTLGVEAWMGKFGKFILPELEKKISPQAAAVRTAHTLIGTALLGVSVALALRVRVRAVTPRPADEPADPTPARQPEPRPTLATAGASNPGADR